MERLSFHYHEKDDLNLLIIQQTSNFHTFYDIGSLAI